MRGRAPQKYLSEEETWIRAPASPRTDSVPCHWELQVVSQLGHFREHVKPIRGEENPSTRLSSAYVGVEREDRKLRRREGNSMSMISGLGAGAWFSHQDGTGFGSRPLRGSNGLLTSGHCQVAHVLERPGPQGAAPLEWLHPAPCQTLPPASKLQKGGSFVRPRFQGSPAPSPPPQLGAKGNGACAILGPK